MAKVKAFFLKIWYVLKPIFKSLFSNQNAYTNGRDKKWYWAVPLFVVSIVFSLLPILITNLNVTGSGIFTSSVSVGSTAAISTRSFYMDEAIGDFVTTLNDNGLEIEIKEEGENKTHVATLNDQAKWNATFGHNKENRYEYYTIDGKRRLEIYYTDKVDTEFTNYINGIYKNTTATDGLSGSSRTTSFMVIGKKSFILYLYSNSSAVGNRQGDYSRLQVGYKFNDLIKNSEGTTLDFNHKQADMETLLTNFKTTLNNIYEPTRLNTAWSTTGIIFAINVGVTVLLGFLLWVLTRGKTNPFRTITLWETQKIAYWCALTPSILTLALGFFLSTYAVIMYVGFLGLRVTWLAMKVLKPTANN